MQYELETSIYYNILRSLLKLVGRDLQVIIVDKSTASILPGRLLFQGICFGGYLMDI